VQPWEKENGKPGRIGLRARHHDRGTARRAAFNNEFRRPNINGYFRTFEAAVPAATAVESDKLNVESQGASSVPPALSTFSIQLFSPRLSALRFLQSPSCAGYHKPIHARRRARQISGPTTSKRA